MRLLLGMLLSFSWLSQLASSPLRFTRQRPLRVTPRPLHVTPRSLHVTPRSFHVTRRTLHVSPQPLHVSPRTVVTYSQNARSLRRCNRYCEAPRRCRLSGLANHVPSATNVS